MIVIQIIAWVLLIILAIVGLLVVLLMAGVFDPPEKRREFHLPVFLLQAAIWAGLLMLIYIGFNQ